MNTTYKTQKLRVEKVSTRTWGLLTPMLPIMLGFLLISFSGISQIENMMGLYRYNPQMINPAYVGLNGKNEVTVVHRNQWVGIIGAPKTNGINTSIVWGENKGIGASLLLDEAGPIKTTLFNADFAYHAKLNEQWKFSGSIRGSLANVTLDLAGLQLVDQTDSYFQSNRSTGLSPNLGWGLLFSRNTDGLFFSLSQARLAKYNFGSDNGSFKDVPYFYFMTGTKIPMGGKITNSNGEEVNRFTLYPSVLFRIAHDVPVSTDLNINGNFRGKVDVGLSLRTSNSYGIRVGVQATPKLYVGYLFESPTSALKTVTTQSHEFALRLSFLPKNKQSRSTESVNEKANNSEKK